MTKQTQADRDILAVRGHAQGPQFIGPRAVRNCRNYDEHRSSFYRNGRGEWVCPQDHDR